MSDKPAVPGSVSTHGEWMVQVSMQMKQISTDVAELKEGFKNVAQMEKNIQADLKILKRDERRVEQLERTTTELQNKMATMAGQFKIVGAILSLALASLFGWVASKGQTKPVPIIIKIDKSLLNNSR